MNSRYLQHQHLYGLLRNMCPVPVTLNKGHTLDISQVCCHVDKYRGIQGTMKCLLAAHVYIQTTNKKHKFV